MSELQAANVLQAIVVWALWAVVIFKLWPDSIVDSFRQQMFCVRDEMFDFAAAGNISFDDPAYVLLRKQMNGLIRYGHHLTLFRSLMTAAITWVADEGDKLSWNHAWEAALGNVQNDETRVRLRSFHERGMMVAVKHLIYRSPILWIALSGVAMCLLAQGAALSFRQLLKAASAKVLAGPLDRRMIEEAAVGSFA